MRVTTTKEWPTGRSTVSMSVALPYTTVDSPTEIEFFAFDPDEDYGKKHWQVRVPPGQSVFVTFRRGGSTTTKKILALNYGDSDSNASRRGPGQKAVAFPVGESTITQEFFTFGGTFILYLEQSADLRPTGTRRLDIVADGHVLPPALSIVFPGNLYRLDSESMYC